LSLSLSRSPSLSLSLSLSRSPSLSLSRSPSLSLSPSPSLSRSPSLAALQGPSRSGATDDGGLAAGNVHPLQLPPGTRAPSSVVKRRMASSTFWPV
jgi:hypothetical protein